MNFNQSFYERLASLSNFKEFTNFQNYADVPEDWYVVITDVISSTKAIEQGKYKDVNITGALSLVAVVNLNPNENCPFIFGGDGVTFLISGQMIEDTLSVLADNRRLVKVAFNLSLRVGYVSVKEIYQSGYQLKVAKHRVSSTYSQLFILGNGIDYAESLIKNPRCADKYLIPENYKITKIANYSGFDCPFEDVGSHKEETISVIIKVRTDDFQHHHIIYKEILEEIEFIFGSFEGCHPLSLSKFKFINSKSDRAKALIKVRLDKKRGIDKYLRTIFLKLSFLITPLYIRIIQKLFPAKNDVISAADYKKFDGTLKMTLACYSEQREDFQKYLQELKEQGKIYFGLHISNRALVTCLLVNHEVHLVDSADGGYALAAKQLKQQLAVVQG
jgi:hypothetical protein